MATPTEIQVTEAYIGLLGRAPDPAGLAYWTAQLDAAVAAGQDATVALKKLTNDIALSPEFTSGAIGSQVPGSGNPSQAQADSIVTSLYQNLFDRNPTQADLDYWTPQLTGGSTTAPEMTLNLITAAKSNPNQTDGEVLGYKQQAATYYEENVGQDDFSRDTATQAVAPVNGPVTLATSKAMTDQVASGVGVTTDLASIGAGNDVPMTASDDTVTGTVGTGATYNTQKINDSYTGDSDTLTLTGNAGFTFAQVNNVETINVSLADTLGGGFAAIDATAVVGGTINLDVADKVTIAGVELAGETVATVSGLGTALSTTDVTNLTVTSAALAASVTTDSDAATVTVNGIEANDTTITMSATTATLNLDGTDAGATTDKAAVSAVGAVALDVSAGAGDDLVENLTLSGNGAAVTYTVTGNTSTASNITVSGDQDVTLAGSGAQFTALKSFTDSSTAGNTTLALSTSGGAGVVASSFGVLSGGIDLTGDFGAQTLTVTTGNTIKVSADQTAAITIATNDDGATGTITLDLDNDVNDIVTTDVDVLTIVAPDKPLSIVDLTAGDNDGAVTIAGTNDVSITGNVTSGDLTINTQKVAITGTVDADGDLTLTASGAGAAGSVAAGALTVDNDIAISGDDITLAGVSTAGSSATDGNVSLTATGNDVDTTGVLDIDGSLTVVSADQFTTGNTLNAENDITITADDVVFGNTVNTQAGGLSITATNDVSGTGAITVVGAMTVSQTGTGGAITLTGDNLVVTNDVSLTGDDVVAADVTSSNGDISITATGNDVNLDGDVVSTLGDVTVKATAGTGNIDATGKGITADNDITVSAGDKVTVDDLITDVGNVVITAGNEVVIGTSAASNIDGTLTVTAGSTVDGIATIAQAIDAENDITLSGDQVEIDAAVGVSVAGNITVTATNDVDLGIGTTGTLTTASGSITVTSGTEAKADAGADAIQATNDVTITADDVQLGNVTSTKAGNIVITATNDANLDGTVTNQTSGNITITAGEVVGGAGNAIDIAGAVVGENDITITASGGGELQFNANNVTSNTAGDLMLTGGQIDGSGTFTATDGDITVNATNDTETSTLGTLAGDKGTVTFLSGKFAVTQIDADAGGVTIAGDAQGTFATVNAKDSEVRITSTNDVTLTTVDTEAVVGTGGGDYALGTVSSSTQTAVQITTGAGNDSMTLNADERFTVVTGDGIDTITGTDSAATTVVNTGGGDDVLNITAATYLGVNDLGAGTGDKVILAATDLSAGATWQNIEILQLAGNTTLSLAQLDNDTSYEIVGANGVITATGVTSIDLSNVSFQAGNTSSYNLTGTGAADTITGSDAVDVIAGGNGNDTINGGLGADTITGGAGLDTMTGGGANDTFIFGNSDSTKASIDVIVDYANGDIIDYGVGAITTTANADAAGEATINANGLVTGYNGAAATFDTLDEKLTQIDLGIGGTAGQAAVFTHDGKTYLYIAVGTNTANDGTDLVIELTGVTAGNISLAGGNIDGIG